MSPISREQVVWRYLRYGRTKHALPGDRVIYAGARTDVMSLCGLPQQLEWWLGRHSAGEIVRLGKLAECRACVALLAPDVTP